MPVIHTHRQPCAGAERRPSIVTTTRRDLDMASSRRWTTSVSFDTDIHSMNLSSAGTFHGMPTRTSTHKRRAARALLQLKDESQKVMASKDTATRRKTRGLLVRCAKSSRTKTPPRAFMGKFGLGNALGVDADARQLVEVAVVPLTAHIGAIYGVDNFY